MTAGPGHGPEVPADRSRMDEALALARGARGATSPNPWVGAVLVTAAGGVFAGATEPPGGRHAEIVALDRAGVAAATTRGAALFVTLEPCCHQGRTPPCTRAIIDAGVRRVIVALEDPDARVGGRGIDELRAAGVEVEVGLGAAEAADLLAPYVIHRTTGRPLVTLKLAATLDGRIAAADGTSRWITGDAARTDAHRLRADHDAVLVGAGTVRADDPQLTVRRVAGRDPLRVVLGQVPAAARVHPALELSGPLDGVLSDLGARGVLSVLVEGGARVAHDFHRAALVDRYVLYLAPALMGGSDGTPVMAGPGAQTITDLRRERLIGVRQLGDDVRIDLARSDVPAVVG